VKGLRVLMQRAAGLFAIRRREREISDEIESHLELHIADNIRSGMPPDEARRAAVIRLGGVTAAKGYYRDRATLPLIENLTQDLRFALRQLLQNPSFAATAIVVLALGLCANVAIFAFVDAALLKPLPYKDPTRLVDVSESTALFSRNNLSYLDYLDWKKLNSVFGSLDVYTSSGYLLNTSSGAEPVAGARVTGGFFQTLGITPVLGRVFHASDDLPSVPQTAVLTYSSWQKRFAGQRDVIGRTIVLSGEQFIIIGVLPAEFQFAPRGNAELWTTLRPTNGCEDRRSCHNLYGIARLKEGISISTALAEMKLIAGQLEKLYPDSNRGQGASVAPLANVVVGPLRPVLFTLLGGAALLLLIAFVNVTTLLLVRSESRRREIAVRNSLGASRGRLIRQFLTEGLLLTAAGGAAGLICAKGVTRLLLKLIPSNLLSYVPFLADAGLNGRVMAFAAGIALLAALLFASAPLLRIPGGDMHPEMAQGGRWSAGLSWRRLGSKLVVLELATAVVLLVSAGLLAKSFYRLVRVDVGFQADHLATISVFAADRQYAKDEEQIALGRRLVAGIAGMPGVRGVALTTDLPVNGNGNTDWIRIAGKPYNGQHNEVNERDVSSGYFKTLGAKLLQGRYFTDAEDESQPKIVVINNAFAKKYFPGENPLGQRIGDTKLTPKSLRVIVGVVDDIHEGSLEEEIWPAQYHPFNQDPSTYFTVVVRTAQDEHSVLPALRGVIHHGDPGVGTADETSFTEAIENSPSAYLHRSSAWLVGGFAALALILGVVGLYGVVAYSVSQRTREIGVRMALGAEQSAVYRLIVKEAGWLVGLGIVCGVLASLAMTGALRQVLFGVEPWDLGTLVGVALVLAAAALAASLAPARRAARLNPVDALRAE
jgi:predicted permease